jgi:hypothetical protein
MENNKDKMNQKPKTIYDFRKGDIITRLEPMVDDDGYKDFSLVGAKLTFVGIANACLYLSKKSDPISKIFLGQDIIQIKLPLALCEKGWAKYIEPDFLDSSPDDMTEVQAIEEEIQKAVENEDYFKAEALKNRLIELQKLVPPVPPPPPPRLLREGGEPPSPPKN